MDHPLQAFFFDRAVTLFGQDVENEMQAAAHSQKTDDAATKVANQVLQRRLASKRGGSGFKDPAKSMSF